MGALSQARHNLQALFHLPIGCILPEYLSIINKTLRVHKFLSPPVHGKLPKDAFKRELHTYLALLRQTTQQYTGSETKCPPTSHDS